MAMKYGKAQMNRVIDVLDQDHETVEDAARAVLAEAERIFEERAKFVVVGQLSGTKERLTIPSDDPEAIKLSLGWYSTEGDARGAAESMWHSAASGDTYRTWVLPVFHGSPAELHKRAKDKYAADAAKAKDKMQERVREGVRKAEAAAEERARLMRTPCKCGHDVLHHKGTVDKPAECAACRCTGYQEGS